MSDDDIATMSYERALAELEQLIRRLEAGQVELEEAIGCYERGVRLAEHCGRLLDRTEEKVTQLVVSGGRTAEAPLAERADEAPQPRGATVAFPGLEPAPGRGRRLPVDTDPDDIPF